MVNRLESGVFSASAWFWPDKSDDDHHTIVALSSSNLKGSMSVGYSDGQIYYSDLVRTTPVYSNATFAKKQWHSLVVSSEMVDKNSYTSASSSGVTSHRKISVYVDGTLAIQVDTRLPDLEHAVLTAGAEYSQYVKRRFFSGLIDELRVYSIVVSQEEVLSLPFHKPIRKTPEAAGQLLYADFNDISEDDIRDKVISAYEQVRGKKVVDVAYCDKITVGLMPYDPIAVGSIAKHSNPFTNALYNNSEGPLRGTNLTIMGANFANTHFLSVLVDGVPCPIEYVSPTKLYAFLPRMDLSSAGSKLVTVTNGGTNSATLSFTYSYVLGEDFDESLIALYQFKGDLVNTARHGQRGYIPKNYGNGGPFSTPDRNLGVDRALQFSRGERVELPAMFQAGTNWTMCMWLYAEPATRTIFFESDAKKHSVANLLQVNSDGILMMDGTPGATLIFDAWQFICIAKHGNSTLMYTSGELNATVTSLYTTSHMAKAYLGTNLTGVVDDLWAWNRTLYDYEIKSLYLAEEYAIELDGTSTGLKITSDEDASEFSSHIWRADGKFTMEMWVNPASVSGTHVLFQQGTGVACPTPAPCIEAIGIEVSIVDGKVSFEVMYDSMLPKQRTMVTIDPVVTAGKWQLIQIVNTLSSMYVAIDGALQNVTAAYGTGPVLVNTFFTDASQGVEEELVAESSTQPITVGYGVFGDYFSGLLGEVRLWSKSLSAAELDTFARCPPKFDEEGLFQTFKFDAAVGNMIYFGKTPSIKMSFDGPKKPYYTYVTYGAQPTSTSWPSTIVTGAGSYIANANTTTRFTVQTRGQCSKIRRTGGDNVQVVLAGPLDRHTRVFMGDVIDNGDGTYYSHYSATMCGFYALRVENASVPVVDGTYTSGHVSPARGEYDSEMAYLSPLKLYINPGPTNASRSYAYDAPDLLENDDLKIAYPGVPASFTLQTVDDFGCLRTSGGDHISVDVYGRWKSYPGTVKDHHNGMYTITYVPHMVGNIYMAVKANGVDVAGAAVPDPKNDKGISLNYEAVGESPWCINVQAGKGSLHFNSTQYVMVRDADHLNPIGSFTIEAWVLPEAPYTDGRFVSKESPYSGHGFYFGIMHGRLAAGVYVGDNTMRILHSEAVLAPDTWSHVAFTYDGSYMAIYVNGAEVADRTFPEHQSFRENSQNVLIGPGWTGLIDEVRIVPRAKSQTEVVAGHNCPMAPEDVLLYYMFNDGAADPMDPEVYDYSIYGREGKLRGTAGIPQFSDMNAPSGVNTLDLSKAHLMGEGLHTAVAGVTAGFTLDLYDQCGFEYTVVSNNTVSSIADKVTTTLFTTEHDSVAYPIVTLDPLPEVSISHDMDSCTQTGRFTMAYTPNTCGTASIDIKVEGQSLPGAPFHAIISPSPETSTSHSVATDVGQTVVAGLATTFTIHARDAYGCQRTSGGDVFDVLLTRISNPSGLMKGNDAVTLSIPMHDNGDGTYTVTYTAPAAGDYIIDVGRAENGVKSAISGSPFMVTATTAPWRNFIVGGTAPSARYEHSMVVYGDSMYLFRGWGANKEALTDSYVIPLTSDGTWAYRQMVSITGMTSLHEIRIYVDTASLINAGKMRDDCHDVRFVSAASHADVTFWMDPMPGCGSDMTLFWVRPSAMNDDVYMYFGNALQTASMASSPESLFVSYDSFESPAEISSWSVRDSCSNPPSDPSAFTLSNFTSVVGSHSLQVDALDKTGGSLVKPLSTMSSYVLRGSLYDSDAAKSAHWMSPNFEDCTTDFQSTKEFLPASVAIGINTGTTEGHYAVLYPWASCGTNRSASWTSLEISSDGQTITFKVNEQIVQTKGAAGFHPLNKIMLRGGDEVSASMAAWDNVYVARYDGAVSVSQGTEEAVSWSGTSWSVLRTYGTQPPPRNAATYALYNSAMYLLGGYGSYGSYGSDGTTYGTYGPNAADERVWLFDFTTHTWSSIEPYGSLRMPSREDHSSATYGTDIYCFGGRDAATGAIFSDMWRYNVPDNAWYQVSSSGPSGRFGMSANVYKKFMFVFGGHTATGVTNEMWAYNFETGTWANLTPMGSPPARFSHTTAISAGSLYVVGGSTMNGGSFSDVWKYDLDYNTWVEVKPIEGPLEKTDVGMVAYGDNLVQFGGTGASSYYADMWGLSVY